ncbi:MAG: CPBP family intramembrane metalloprotease [Verrucomicrobia bacterium]|nr:CPBP family intramembrane metalloprotease [Verrucomicrobiota bacterium]
MPPAPDLPAVLLTLLLLGAVGGSLALWFARWLAPHQPIQEHEPLAAWSIGWINFGIFLCSLLVGIYLIQILGFGMLTALGVLDSEIPEQLTPGLALASIVLLQFPALFIILGLRNYYPRQFSGTLETRLLPWLIAARKTFPTFLRYLPLIWIASILWNYIVKGLRSLGIVNAAPPQELVELFSGGGSPILIALLALSAVLLAPYVEEILFRGCIYRFLKSKTLIPFAQLISGVLFAAIHGNLSSFGPLIVVGILLAHVYEKEGSLRMAICFHAFFNAFSLTLILLAANSEVVPLP